ncbi:hypothetical protein HK100_007464 [Physocladia obscura]|uniref:Uncharacterized protein n=1 Tax=Physocladia obscura TaxID=109957 RepID=A0AAD5T754_9FUNG|nr:hypothetical protein HK100_007464 [Physocladia obscura]
MSSNKSRTLASTASDYGRFSLDGNSGFIDERAAGLSTANTNGRGFRALTSHFSISDGSTQTQTLPGDRSDDSGGSNGGGGVRRAVGRAASASATLAGIFRPISDGPNMSPVPEQEHRNTRRSGPPPKEQRMPASGRRLTASASRSTISLAYEEAAPSTPSPRKSSSFASSTTRSDISEIVPAAGRKNVFDSDGYNILNPPLDLPARPSFELARYQYREHKSGFSLTDSSNNDESHILAISPSQRKHVASDGNRSSIVFGDVPLNISDGSETITANISALFKTGKKIYSGQSNRSSVLLSQSPLSPNDSSNHSEDGYLKQKSLTKFANVLNQSAIVFGDDGPRTMNKSKIPIRKKSMVFDPKKFAEMHETLAEFAGFSKQIDSNVVGDGSTSLPSTPSGKTKKDPAAVPYSAGRPTGKFRVY